MEDNFSMDQSQGGWFQDDSSTLTVHFISIIITLDHQASCPRSWGPLLYTTSSHHKSERRTLSILWDFCGTPAISVPLTAEPHLHLESTYEALLPRLL